MTFPRALRLGVIGRLVHIPPHMLLDLSLCRLVDLHLCFVDLTDNVVAIFSVFDICEISLDDSSADLLKRTVPSVVVIKASAANGIVCMEFLKK